jgi:uncharacterized membrane protein
MSRTPSALGRSRSPGRSQRAPRPRESVRLQRRGWLDALAARPGLVLATMIGLYAAIYVTVAMIKYHYYLYTDLDLALFGQAVDQLRHGSTWNSVRGMDWRGDHSSLLLYLIAPLTWMAPRAASLLVLQSVVLALGAIPVWRMARRALADEPLALVCAALYLCHPAVGYANLFEFHPETLCTTTMMWALDALLAGALGRTLVFAALSLAGKEDVAVAVLGMAAFALTLRRPHARPAAVGLATLAAVSLAISFLWLKPAFSHGEIDAARMYGVPDVTASGVARALASRPAQTIASLWMTPGDPTDSLLKRQFYLHLLLPLGFLPLLAPAPLLLGALPVIAQHFLSSRVSQHTVVHQYTAAATPFLVTAAVLALASLRGWGERRGSGPKLARVGGAVGLAASLAANLMFGPLLGHGMLQQYSPTEHWRPTPRDELLRPVRDRMVARIPGDAGVVASFEYLPRLAARARLHSFHNLFLGHYMLSEKPYPLPDSIGAILSAFGDQFDAGAMERFRALIARDSLRPVDAIDDLVLYLRAPRDTLELLGVVDTPPSSSARVIYDAQLEFAGCDIDTPRVARGGAVTFRTYWRRVGPVDRVFLTRLWVIDPHGKVALFRTRYLGYGLQTADRWPAGSMVRESYRLGLPRSLESGTYPLVMQVVETHDGRAGVARSDDPRLEAIQGTLQLGIIEVE